jgi:hypothetical protein
MATRPGGVDQLSGEALHRAEQGYVVDLDAALSGKLLQIPVRQGVARVPADSQQDHLGGNRNPENPDGRTSTVAQRRRRFISPACRTPPSMQQRPLGTHLVTAAYAGHRQLSTRQCGLRASATPAFAWPARTSSRACDVMMAIWVRQAIGELAGYERVS